MRRIDLRTVQAAHLDTIRFINRQIVLNYVREREPISRAEIARKTELQRSTISEIIEEALMETIERSVRRGLPSARILPSTLGSQPTLMGALSLVLAGKFAAASAA